MTDRVKSRRVGLICKFKFYSFTPLHFFYITALTNVSDRKKLTVGGSTVLRLFLTAYILAVFVVPAAQSPSLLVILRLQ